jgi:hypothetical protein
MKVQAVVGAGDAVVGNDLIVGLSWLVVPAAIIETIFFAIVQ